MTTSILMSPTRVIFGGGKFDSDKRYVRGEAASPTFAMVKGITIYLQSTPDGHSISWRWSDGVSSVTYTSSGGSAPSSNPAYTPAVVTA
ncbi:MAG: hypothetical protein AB7O13_24750 [Alphaproteobacteria bacterium]